MAFTLPDDLMEQLKERRVIPFIGAGFSAALGLPDWSTLLREVSKELDLKKDFDEIERCCQGDYLQIAEYLFLKCDRSVGPIRHVMSRVLQATATKLSTAHIELVNLNAPQIYTTNYDEEIEKTFRRLLQPYASVALPKHIAGADRTKTQIVKYHGDLRFDATLVLTESSYYNRLEFESPLDLKFRSDLLGRSVLFIGYSFRDINIRIIWFKLMEMMKDVPESDRPSSYIVRFDKNEILEDLYRAVGIKTIYLDPAGSANVATERTALLDKFMLELSLRVSDDGAMPGGDEPMHLSPGLLAELQRDTKRAAAILRRRDTLETLAIRHAANRKVLPELVPAVDKTLEQLAISTSINEPLATWALRFFKQNPSSNGAALCILLALSNSAGRQTVLRDGEFPWAALWSLRLPAAHAARILDKTENEFRITHLEVNSPDHDLAYLADIAKRIASGTMVDEQNAEAVTRATKILAEIAALYPAVGAMPTAIDGPPSVKSLLAQIDLAIEEMEASQGTSTDDEIPF